MSEKDILFIIGAVMGLIGGYQVGHGRGYIAGVRWCTKRLDEPTASAAKTEVAL